MEETQLPIPETGAATNLSPLHPWRSALSALGDIAVMFLMVAFIAFFLASIQAVLTVRYAPTAGNGFWHQFLGIHTAHAAPLKGFEAMQVSVSGSDLVMKPGETKTVTASFLNIGETTWSQSGTAFVSVYTYEPKYRMSVFKDSSWYGADQPAVLSEASVAPQQTGTIKFTLKAPTTTGSYTETFYLAAEDTAWIPGGLFSVKIRVENGTTTSSTSPTPTAPATIPAVVEGSTDGYGALVLLRSAKSLTAKGGEALSYTVGIKNTGTTTWDTRTVRTPEFAIAASRDYKHSSWIDSGTLIVKSEADVAPGALDFLSFQFTAPRTSGSHVVKFVLMADDVIVPGGEISIPVEVTSDAPIIKDAPRRETTTNTEDNDVEEEDQIDQPIIRVGVLIVDDETDNQVVITCASDFEVRDGEGHLIAEMDANEEISAFYKKSQYWYNRGSGLEQTNSYLRFIPEEENAVCTVTNFDRRVTRNAANPDNTFRNILELRYNSSKDRTWLINELPMEYYLRGLAETSNISHLDFQKALITAARTYAFYHWERYTKHDDEFYHVDAYADQVYNGYGQEARTPRLTQSVTETAGVIVQYDGKTAITPYFSRSDGRTRDWGEVWYGEVEWLKSVPTPCDEGKVLWGHGVGMSASAALCMANNGEDWKDILTYFYTGVDLVERWED